MHKKAVEILESQGPHGKAQYIANAVLCYANYLEKPEASQTQTAWIQDEEYLKRLIREVLGYEMEAPSLEMERIDSPHVPGQMSRTKRQDTGSDLGAEPNKHVLYGLKSIDTAAMSLISATMSEFRNG